MTTTQVVTEQQRPLTMLDLVNNCVQQVIAADTDDQLATVWLDIQSTITSLRDANSPDINVTRKFELGAFALEYVRDTIPMKKDMLSGRLRGTNAAGIIQMRFQIARARARRADDASADDRVSARMLDLYRQEQSGRLGHRR